MELHIKAIFRQGNLMELVSLITIMEINMKVLSKMVLTMELGSLHGQMECQPNAPMPKEPEIQENS